MRRLPLLATIVCTFALALVSAGCGADYSDLFLVRRTGVLPDADVQIVVNDGGTISCDRGEFRELPSRMLLDGRDIMRSLREDLEFGKVHPRAPNAQLRFRIDAPDGTISFSETDGAHDEDLARLVQLVRELSQQMCGLAR
ncbi:hypothetical protein [Conexibacter sp. CPCC 206217]|uniref:hypothetical protein n=1 Tax=Conexibacter sp. CPCC 206217 TaxID=3064574 RepID=UPI0027220786|nr:hypothetical protein [Conexibacter sp. CPCC 206217]MDO8213044.1 hypothetical protein [Conexibacter sp. CPCC 206217]